MIQFVQLALWDESRDKSLEGFTRGDLLHIERAKFMPEIQESVRRDERGPVLNSETGVKTPKFTYTSIKHDIGDL